MTSLFEPAPTGDPVDVVALGFRPWSQVERVGVNVRDLHLTAALAETGGVRRILHVSRPVPPVERWVRGTPHRLESGIPVAKGPGWRLYQDPNFTQVYPLILSSRDLTGPVFQGRRWWQTSLTSSGLRAAVRSASAELELRTPTLLDWVPFAPGVASGIAHGRYVFDLIDNFTDHARINREGDIRAALEKYAEVVGAADEISGVSQKALDSIGAPTDRSRVIRNGVPDAWLELSPEVPADLAPLLERGPVVGTGGYLFEKFRVDILCEMARALPDVSFVIIGKILLKEISQAIETLPNIHYLGMKHIRDVPAYYHHFDAGFILYNPSKENDGDPLKLYEMLACGTPVVSLPSMGIVPNPGAVEVMQSAVEGVEHIRALCGEDRERRRERARRALAPGDRWSAKGRQLLEMVAAPAHDAASDWPQP